MKKQWQTGVDPWNAEDAAVCLTLGMSRPAGHQAVAASTLGVHRLGSHCHCFETQQNNDLLANPM